MHGLRFGAYRRSDIETGAGLKGAWIGCYGGHRLQTLPSTVCVGSWIAEAGVPNYSAVQWYGLLAPAGTPAAIILRLNAVAVKALRTDELKDKLASDGAEPVGSTPAEFARHIRDELETWTRVARAAGIEQQ